MNTRCMVTDRSYWSATAHRKIAIPAVHWHHCLNAGFSILTISRPGYGRTPSSVGRSNTEAADALVALLDQLEIPQCSVIAISGGGPTGIAIGSQLSGAGKRPGVDCGKHVYGKPPERSGLSKPESVLWTSAWFVLGNAASVQHAITSKDRFADSGHLLYT